MFWENALFGSGRNFKFDFIIYLELITSQSTGKYKRKIGTERGRERTGVRVVDDQIRLVQFFEFTP